MSFLRRIFNSTASASPAQPDIAFGRYTDAYKPDQLFETAVQEFEAGEVQQAYRNFLQYLKDSQQDNITCKEADGVLSFDFWQGSQHVYGTITNDKIRVESRVAQADDLNVGFLRRLMEYNFRLQYSRFTLDNENCLTIVFDSHTVDGSPLKLLHAFRELAIHADKQDDLLLEEFRSLSPAEPRLFGEIPMEEKEVKYAFIQRSIGAVFTLINNAKPDPHKYAVNYAYSILALTFKLDYLIKPEGFMMDTLERIRGIFFQKSDRTAQMKVTAACKELQQLLDRPKEAFFREMYRTRSTFGINPAVNLATIVNSIEGEMPKMDWPMQQNYAALALAVPDYIVSSALFHHTPPAPVRELFHLYWQIREAGFFEDLGFDLDYVDAAGAMDKKAILQEIKNIAQRHRMVYPHLKPIVQNLVFDGPIAFTRSYLQMLKSLNLTKTP